MHTWFDEEYEITYNLALEGVVDLLEAGQPDKARELMTEAAALLIENKMNLEIVPDVLGEAAPKRKFVIRRGKKIRRLFCPSGFRVQGKRCVKMSSSQRNKLSRIQRKASRKRKAKKSQSRRKFRRSIGRRKSIGAK